MVSAVAGDADDAIAGSSPDDAGAESRTRLVPLVGVGLGLLALLAAAAVFVVVKRRSSSDVNEIDEEDGFDGGSPIKLCPTRRYPSAGMRVLRIHERWGKGKAETRREERRKEG